MCHDANGEEVQQCPQYHSSCVGVVTEKFGGRFHQQHSSQHPEHHQGMGQAKDQQHLEHTQLYFRGLSEHSCTVIKIIHNLHNIIEMWFEANFLA